MYQREAWSLWKPRGIPYNLYMINSTEYKIISKILNCEIYLFGIPQLNSFTRLLYWMFNILKYVHLCIQGTNVNMHMYTSVHVHTYFNYIKINSRCAGTDNGKYFYCIACQCMQIWVNHVPTFLYLHRFALWTRNYYKLRTRVFIPF